MGTGEEQQQQQEGGFQREVDAAEKSLAVVMVAVRRRFKLLAPTGALVLMMVRDISEAANPLFQIFTQSIDAIDVTSVTLNRLNSINAIDVTRCWGYLGDISGIFLKYLGDIFGISLGYL